MFSEFFNLISNLFSAFNFIDIAILVVIAVYSLQGYALGFVKSFADFLTFVFSFAFGLSFYSIFGDFLIKTFDIPKGFGNALGFFLGAFVFEIILTLLFRFLVLPFILKSISKLKYSKILEKYAGIIPGALSAIVLLSFILTLVVTLPITPYLKNAVASSRFGEPLVGSIQGFDKKLNKVFGGAAQEALTFLTIEPKSDELIQLNFNAVSVKVDEDSEKEMLSLVNLERKQKGLDPVIGNKTLQIVARSYCEDMLRRGYFSHYTPEGLSPFDRMINADIEFNFAGENLAIAPSTKLAMQGLMNSTGHRENILSLNFGEVGIGVMDAGIYGKAFCQEFKD